MVQRKHSTTIPSSERESIMITKATYIARRGASLNALDLEIARLTDYATEDVAVNYYAAIYGLQATREKAETRLRELHAVSDTAWVGDDPTMGVEDAWRELRDAVIAAISTTYCEASRRPSGRHTIGGPHHNNRARRIAPRGSCY